jgi:hypothetical protein
MRGMPNGGLLQLQDTPYNIYAGHSWRNNPSGPSEAVINHVFSATLRLLRVWERINIRDGRVRFKLTNQLGCGDAGVPICQSWPNASA